MGEYLPDEAMEELDEEYLHQLEQLGEDEECCYLIAEDKPVSYTHLDVLVGDLDV